MQNEKRKNEKRENESRKGKRKRRMKTRVRKGSWAWSIVTPFPFLQFQIKGDGSLTQ